MTRINVGIQPFELCDRHLLAEHRELKRIPNMVRTKHAHVSNIPSIFALGTGHVRFFYDKFGYLKERYGAIHAECIRRGFRVADYSSSFNDIPTELMNDYEPTRHDREIVVRRINQRLDEMNLPEWKISTIEQ